MKPITITNVKTILTAPAGIRLVVVKVETSEPEIYGLGCATFTQRHHAVATAVDLHLKPFLIGKDVHRIEDIFQTAMVNAYWRNGPVLNNAISGVDIALWDSKAMLANMPFYQLLGGKCREAAAVYRHADGATPEAVAENVLELKEQGYQYIRCQMGGYGGRGQKPRAPPGAPPGAYYDPARYAPRVAPKLAPEQTEWFRILRNQTATPIAMGELFNNQREWIPLVAEGMIDFIRTHISQIGGLTPARKMAAFCELYSVRTAWHGPGDVSPVGHAANLHLDISSPNFGIQEAYI